MFALKTEKINVCEDNKNIQGLHRATNQKQDQCKHWKIHVSAPSCVIIFVLSPPQALSCEVTVWHGVISWQTAIFNLYSMVPKVMTQNSCRGKFYITQLHYHEQKSTFLCINSLIILFLLNYVKKISLHLTQIIVHVHN